MQSENNLKEASLILLNIYSKEVKRVNNINGESVTIDKTFLESGIYFIRLIENNKIIDTRKIIITDK